VKKRPYCDDFLRLLSPHFEIVMFTASLAKYAQPLFNRLDPTGTLIDHVLFREHCTLVQNEYYVKDMARLGRPLESTIIIDNSPASYLFQPENALPCISWYTDPQDLELSVFIPILLKIAQQQKDVREILRLILKKGNKLDMNRVKTLLGFDAVTQVNNLSKRYEPQTVESSPGSRSSKYNSNHIRNSSQKIKNRETPAGLPSTPKP